MQRSSPTERIRFKRLQCVRAARTIAATLLLARIFIPHAIAQPPRTAESKPTEYDVKAAYLLNFGKFIRPSSRQAPHSSFDICILGPDPMGQTLDSLASTESVNKLPVHVRRLTDVTESRTCAIVYISSFETDRIREDLAILGDAGVLTVSDAEDFLQRGGMIQFVVVANHVRFAVNIDAVNRAHLVLSSELLRVASSVTGKPPTGGLP